MKLQNQAETWVSLIKTEIHFAFTWKKIVYYTKHQGFKITNQFWLIEKVKSCLRVQKVVLVKLHFIYDK